MLVTFSVPSQKNGALGALNYFLDSSNRDVAPVLLSGNPKLTSQLLLASRFKNPYTAGCLSFATEESNLAEELKQYLMQSFEETLLAGLEPNQYDICWIEHADKGRLELNFHIVNTELKTGKRLQPYLHKFDLKRINMWKSLQNDLYGLADPSSPERSRMLQFGRSKGGWQDAKLKIHDYLEQCWFDGDISCRNDLIKELNKLNIKVVRQGKDYISIKIQEINKNIRLKGELYNEYIGKNKAFSEVQGRKQKDYYNQREQRIDKNRESLYKLNKRIAEFRREKYKKVSCPTEKKESVLYPDDFYCIYSFGNDFLSSDNEFLQRKLSCVPNIQNNETERIDLQNIIINKVNNNGKIQKSYEALRGDDGRIFDEDYERESEEVSMYKL
ncbi:relaxase/mobilization nuclease domain-containing protein [Vibrio aestuarianus]|uniref:relaxase/mobilization nuclease domain-containing protein n=1 Tax=Vibrio aestuarianus TaxID=28171 RepID=UPI0021C296E1|nr:relaxase/mobilization nuclease domain-containing protein [Vibrio aestuarianus]CAH8186156.1 hypothetical protein VAE142_690003 [Vibrio aestuarianus]